MSKVAVDPDRRLAAALLLQAVRDAAGDDPTLAAEARRWLGSAGLDLVEALDIHPERVEGWVMGLPALLYEQLTLFDG